MEFFISQKEKKRKKKWKQGKRMEIIYITKK